MRPQNGSQSYVRTWLFGYRCSTDSEGLPPAGLGGHQGFFSKLFRFWTMAWAQLLARVMTTGDNFEACAGGANTRHPRPPK